MYRRHVAQAALSASAQHLHPTAAPNAVSTQGNKSSWLRAWISNASSSMSKEADLDDRTPEALISNLRKYFQTHRPKLLESKKSASVAILLRVVNEESHKGSRDNSKSAGGAAPRPPRLDVLLIRRAINPRDFWSGQMAFPGGRRNTGETTLQTAIREVKEEIDIDVERDFYLLGQLNDRPAKNLSVSTYVFLQRSHIPLLARKQSKEVSDILWVDFERIFAPERRALRKLHLQTTPFLPKTGKDYWKKLTRLVGSDEMIFPCIYLPRVSEDSLEYQAPLDETESQRAMEDFVLWGLTFGMLSDFCEAIGFKAFRWSLFATFRNPLFNVILYFIVWPYRSTAVLVSTVLGAVLLCRGI